MAKRDNILRDTILDLVPSDGSNIGNQALLTLLQDRVPGVLEEAYQAARDALVDDGLLGKGRGRGGLVHLIVADEEDDSFGLTETEEDLTPRQAAKRPGKRRTGSGPAQVISYRHQDKRLNNPDVGMVHPENDPDAGKTRWAYDPHIDPALQFDTGRAQIERLIDDALESGDADAMRDALAELKRLQSPYLNWSGKAERTSFEVDTVSLHVHERIDPASILRAVKKRMEGGDGFAEAEQLELFQPAFENKPLRQALDFYSHEKGWANRLIAGDSLLVMNSLIQKESMAGRVQMIYIDPPYGIKYGSNFQPFVNKRDVKDRKDEDLTQEPETIKAFRDTWELGIHSYLTYLRDRLLLARELLSESGSIFVQISDENLHYVRGLLDEILGAENFIGQITFIKTSGTTSETVSRTADFLIWYAKDASQLKFRPIFLEKKAGQGGGTGYNRVELVSGERLPLRSYAGADGKIFCRDNITSQSTGREKGEGAACWFQINVDGIAYTPSIQATWKTNEDGMRQLHWARRIEAGSTSPGYVRFLDDFPVFPISDYWGDVMPSFMADKTYVVQTSQRVIERCFLMTTDPGDLVLDPTCGSGTTAFVAEKWGRRWITCDTSRVAVTLAKQRLATASFDYYEMRYPHEGLKGGFIYKTVPHTTLKSIANNPEINEIYERMHPVITVALADLNAAMKGARCRLKVAQGGRKGEWIDFAAAEGETVQLPSGDPAPLNAMLEWEVPFDFPDDWSEGARTAFDAFHTARREMQAKMDEAIANHSEPETLYDQPQVAKDKLRITGPFTVEAVPSPTVLALDKTRPPDAPDASIARQGETSRQAAWRDELLRTGIRGKGGQRLQIAELETVPGLKFIHASGTMAESGERVLVSFGPEHAALEQRQVALALTEAEKLRPAPKFIVFCAFTFDPEAAKDIDEINWPGVTLLKAQMNTDLLTEDLKKARSTNESFWLMGQPDVDVRQHPDGTWEVEVNGFDYFDTKADKLVSGGKGKIAMWMLDPDYDERSLIPRQVFFPMAGAKDGWNRLKKTVRAALDADLLEAFHGTISLPFEAGDNAKVAVKIVDDRGIESLKIVALD